MTAKIALEQTWKEALLGEFEQPYMVALRKFLAEQKQARKVIYPKGAEIFAALDATPIPEVRVVIIGQDPYHGPGQAHGLCFSVCDNVDRPPSLVNIFKEIEKDLQVKIPAQGGSLMGWAEQGVLLLNSVLTVEKARAASHQGQGWETFTDAVVETINSSCDGVVFLLWGSYAQKKGAKVDRDRHLVLTAPHPSPLSAHRGFFGCQHFSQANQYLLSMGGPEINWLDIRQTALD